MALETNKIITAFIAVLVGIVLIPVVNTEVVAAGLTGSLGTIVSLIPLMFGLGILTFSLKSMLK